VLRSVVLSRFTEVVFGMQMMSMRYVSVMRRFLMVTCGMVLGCFLVMIRSMPAMFCCLLVMFNRVVCHFVL
jgi:hypothetical protein